MWRYCAEYKYIIIIITKNSGPDQKTASTSIHCKGVISICMQWFSSYIICRVVCFASIMTTSTVLRLPFSFQIQWNLLCFSDKIYAISLSFSHCFLPAIIQ